jgi:cation transport ATPase
MKLYLKVLAALGALPLFVLGFKAMLMPSSMIDMFELTPKAIFGFNTIRADLGGLLVGSGAMICIGIWQKNKTWFAASAFMMALLLCGRLISTVADGWTNEAIPAIVVEVYAVIVLMLAYIAPSSEN